MNEEEFENYKKERYQDQINWYEKKASSNQSRYSKIQWVLIIFSALTPVLIAIDFGFTEYSFLKWVAVITAIIVSISAGSLRIFKYHDNWITYRTTCETLKKEIHLYNAGIGDYTNAKDKESVFVQRVESLISQENTLWLTVFKKDDKGTTTHSNS